MKNKMIKISRKISTALVVAASVMTIASITAFAAPADEVTLHTTQMTFEITEGEEPHEITDAQRQQLRENLELDAQANSYGLTDEEKEIYKESRKYMRKECEKVGDFFEDIINFFS